MRIINGLNVPFLPLIWRNSCWPRRQAEAADVTNTMSLVVCHNVTLWRNNITLWCHNVTLWITICDVTIPYFASSSQVYINHVYLLMFVNRSYSKKTWRKTKVILINSICLICSVAAQPSCYSLLHLQLRCLLHRLKIFFLVSGSEIKHCVWNNTLCTKLHRGHFSFNMLDWGRSLV